MSDESKQPDIVFYDLETNIPPDDSVPFEIIEFGAIVLDKAGLYEKESYSTLIYSELMDERSIACNGITFDMVKDAPSFAEVADKIFDVLNGRVWAGHNIIKFDNIHIKSHFDRLGKPAPEPFDLIDTRVLLRQTFGPRAGNMKLATLGHYFGLGMERHRSIEDVRMNIDVLKNCAMTIFLEEHHGLALKPEPSPEQDRMDKVIALLSDVMQKKEDVWIAYDGGSNPLIPRKIRPIEWVHEPWMFKAWCYQSRCEKNFTQRKVTEIRYNDW